MSLARLQNLSRLQAGLLLFAVAFLVRVAFILAFHPYRDLERYELERTAISLATQGLYGNPYAIPTGPTAHVSPGYTLILAGLFKLFGTGQEAEIIKELLACAVSALGCAVLPSVADALGLERKAGILSGLLSALFLDRPMTQIDGDWETIYTALALMLVSVLTVQLWKRQRFTLRNALFHGFCWGVVLLFVSALLSLLLAFVAMGLWIFRNSELKKYLGFALVELIVAGLCLTPWAIRNHHSLGSPILTRSNFGLELRLSNNDLASPDQRVNLLQGVYDKFHPLQNASEARKLRTMGEVAYNEQAMEEAKDWIRTHPRRFLELCLGRARCFWFYIDPTSPLKTAFILGTAVLGLAGLLYVFSISRTTGIALGIVMLIYPLPNYLVHVGLRQQYPLQWLMTLLSVVLLLEGWRRIAAKRQMPLPAVPASPRGTPARY